MKKILLSILIASAALAQQHPTWNVGTIGVGVSAATVSFSVSATGPAWHAVSWIPSANHTLTEFSVMVNSVTGTIGSADMQGDVYTDSGSGAPNALVGGGTCSTTTVNAVPTGPAMVRFTGLTCALTAGTQYWLLTKNNNASSNGATFTIRYGSATAETPLLMNSTSTLYAPLMVATTANGGGAWGTLGSSMGFTRVVYNDSSVITYAGNPLTGLGPVDATNKVFSTNENGTVFTTGVVGYKVRSITTPCGKQGSPSGNLRIKMYQGASGTLTLLDTSAGVAQGYFGTTGASSCTFFFSTVLTLAANTTFRWAFSDSATDSTSVYYKGFPTSFDTDANSIPLLPFNANGTLASNQNLQQVYCTGTCTTASNWSNITGQYLPFVLNLDYAGEYVTPTGGGPRASAYVQ